MNISSATSFIMPWKNPQTGGDAWFSAGLTSTYPDIHKAGEDLSALQPGEQHEKMQLGCKVFRVPPTNAARAVEITAEEISALSDISDLTDQVLIFQYKGKFHAVDHRCPHSSFPLSHGAPFDIEDFGVVFGSCLTCPKHGWTFDLFSGKSDRRSYALRVWDVELRDVVTAATDVKLAEQATDSPPAKEVWVRRKPERRG